MNTIPATFPDFRSLLFPIAYNMLSDSEDAEDLVQETLLTWLSMNPSGIENPRGYLIKTLINKCLNFIRRRNREQSLNSDVPLRQSSGMILSGIVGDSHHISLGLLALLEKLSPQERGVFMLKEVFDYSHKEIAEILGITEAYCRQILRRARKHLQEDRVRFEVDEAEHQEWLERFVEVCEGEDIGELLSLLQREVRIVEPAAAFMPAEGAWEVAEQFLDFIQRGGDMRIIGKGQHALIGLFEYDKPRAWLMLKPLKYQLAEIHVFDPFAMPPLPYVPSGVRQLVMG